MDEVIREVLDVLNGDHIEEYPRDAIDKALAREKEIVPYLVEILENALRDPSSVLSRERFHGHIFAMNLLAHFRYVEAHETIVKLMSLPPGVVDHLFGDMITEDFPRILYQTCDGNYERIKDLVLNKEADEYVRGSAMRALVWGVLLGDLPRSSALEFLGGLFVGNEAEEGSYFWDGAASCVCDLYPEELMDTIRDAYSRGLISPGFIGIENFERALSQNMDDHLAKERHWIERRIHEDFHNYMAWWACFDRNVMSSFGKGDDHFSYRAGSKAAKKKAKKNRKKMSKASKRKNRRR